MMNARRPRVVVVTGGSRGLGSIIVDRFAGQDLVFVLDRLPPESSSPRLNTVHLAIDVGEFDAVHAACDRIVSYAARVDVLINNAASIRAGPFVDQTPSDWEDMISTNVKGVLNCCRVFGKVMIDQRNGGRIVNIASTDGHVGKIGHDSELGVIGVVVYAATKGAIIAFTKALAVEWGKYGLAVNAVSPGLMRTPMTEHLFQSPEKLEVYRRTLPLGGITEPSDVCETVFFLASPAASRITGQIWAIDSGYLAVSQ